MKTMRTGLAFVCLSLALGTAGCGSSPSSSALTPTALGAKYKVSATDITGWQLDPADPNAFQVLDESTSKNLVTLIDGGAGAYTDRGCTVTIYQSLVGPNGEIAGPVYAMDFGTAANATTMFNYSKDSYSATDTVPGFDASVAIGHAALVSVTVFAHFGAMYFEMTLSGFSDQTAAYQGAAQFLNVFKSRMN